ncbi:MAG: tetratricopeptide repeat protein, partial [Nannocystaceae bacterium]|nr:tetratricopeptide repeat protein [Nannocystaceae bacterium]
MTKLPRRWTIGLCLVAGLLACTGDLPAAVTEPGEAVAVRTDPGPVPTPTDATTADDRALWFSSGPGRDAIVARQRRDHDTAVARLDALLADPSLSADDRGAAQWLRGLEDLRMARYRSAAVRFAEARGAPGLALVDVRLRMREARARLSASQPELALALANEIDATGTPHEADLLIVRGDALLRTDEFAGAKTAYEGYLALSGGKRRAEVRAKLARTLVSMGGKAELKAAVTHYEKILVDVPLSDYGVKAARLLPALRKKAGVSKASGGFSRRVALSRTQAMVDRRRYRDAIHAADAILAKVGPGAEQCRALFLKGTATFKQRQRAKARPVFDKADKACAKAGKAHETTRVKSRYQGARGLYAEGKYTRAAAAFESLATDHAKHSYADDAWILAGESWEEANKPKDARRVYRLGLAVGGDMQAEPRRRLLVMAFAVGDHDDALKLTESGLSSRPGSPKEHAKLQYFRGRALAELGRTREASEAWVEAVRALPLGYASLQALSRL